MQCLTRCFFPLAVALMICRMDTLPTHAASPTGSEWAIENGRLVRKSPFKSETSDHEKSNTDARFKVDSNTAHTTPSMIGSGVDTPNHSVPDVRLDPGNVGKSKDAFSLTYPLDADRNGRADSPYQPKSITSIFDHSIGGQRVSEIPRNEAYAQGGRDGLIETFSGERASSEYGAPMGQNFPDNVTYPSQGGRQFDLNGMYAYSSKYLAYDDHPGYDFRAQSGTTVLSSAAGQAKWLEKGDLGNYVQIDHGNGYFTIYAHLSEAKGIYPRWVEQGDLIALSGNSGLGNGGAHLHFQVLRGGDYFSSTQRSVDPYGFLGANVLWGNATPDPIDSNVDTNDELVIRPSAIHPDLKIAWEAANVEGKRLLVDFYGSWCPWCVKMDETLADSSVRPKMSDFYYHKVKVDPFFSSSKSLTDKYQVDGIPHFIIFDENGNVSASQDGFMDPSEFISFLQSGK